MIWWLSYIFHFVHFLTDKVHWREVPKAERPLIALVALDDDVRLGILSNSVNLVTTERKMIACQTTEFKFQRGEVLLMHPALVHYGCAYKAQERSLRAHYYFDNPVMVSNSKGRETYLFQEVIQPMPLNQCLAARGKKSFESRYYGGGRGAGGDNRTRSNFHK